MKKKMIILGLAFTSLLGACSTEKLEEMKNLDFEYGNLAYWDVEGEAFTKTSVTLNSKSDSGEIFNNQGDFLFYGKKSGLASTGTMTSKPFKLTGSGKVGFLIGAGKNYDKCYVELIDSKGNTIDARGNEEFNEPDIVDALHRVVIDASNHLNEVVRIRIVDNDNGTDGYNYINVDDFIIGYEGSEEQVGKVYEATKYTYNNLNTVNQRYRHTYHAMTPIGWANDPNGFTYYGGKIHLFHQYNPYSTAWGPMHWGHYTSTDFIKWELQNVALAPDQSYDKDFGAFSGSAIEKDGKLYLMYTGVANNLQQQCIAVSEDGINFEKIGRNPVISASMIPAAYSKADFRDPYVYKKGDTYYCLIGTKRGNYGNMLMYKSKNLTSWSFVGEVMNSSNKDADNFFQLSGVYECPAYAYLDGKEVLICSPQNLPANGTEFENIHSVVAMVGEFDYNTGRFIYDKFQEIDSGFDFYAAQTMQMPDGRTVMIAWMQMWDRTMPTQADGWVGAFTLPRELSVKNNHLYQTPVKEIENYRKDKVTYSNVNLLNNESISLENINGNTLELEFTLNMQDATKAGVKLFKGTIHETTVYYDAVKGDVVLDRSKSGVNISGVESNRFTRSASVELVDGNVKFRIFLDVSSIEVFINDGYSTITANVYPDSEDLGIEFFAVGGNAILESITKYTIEV